MTPPTLKIAKAKIDRALVQIGNLEDEVSNFILTNSCDIVTQLNAGGTEQIWRFVLRNRDMTHLSVLAGEIGHNLRTPLDNLISAIAIEHYGPDARAYFPFGQNVHAFDENVARHGKKIPPEALDLIYRFQPYKGGNDLLWALHEMNSLEKHPGLDAISSVQAAGFGQIAFWEGVPLIIGSRQGAYLSWNGYEPKPYDTGMDYSGEFMTTTPGAMGTANVKPRWQVAFKNIPGFEQVAVVRVLRAMHSTVDEIFITLRNRFF